jgi:glycosyltransferase involved in cell wall biosynthesis
MPHDAAVAECDRAAADPGGARPWLLVSAAFVKTGGQDRANYALAKFLSNRGRTVHVVSHRLAPELGPGDSLAFHPTPRPLRSDLLGEPFLQQKGASWARHLHDAHVVVNGGNCAWPDVNWVHYVHTAYTPDPDGHLLWQAKQQLAHRLFRRAEQQALHAARLVIANSNRTKRDLVERVGVSSDRIRVVYYGTEPAEFRPAEIDERLRTRADVGWPADRPIVLFIGALGDRRKGFDTLIAGWQRLAAFTRFDPLLAVIGRGAMLEEWQRHVVDAGLEHAVTFLGFRNDVPRLVRAADLLVAPTRYEAYGLGVHEALCCGLPAIVSAHAGVAERYPSNLSALLLADPEDPDNLAGRIEACLDGYSDITRCVQPFSDRLRERSWDDMALDIERAVTQ